MMSAVSLSIHRRKGLLGRPLLPAGMWSGFKLDGKLDAAFCKVILLLLLVLPPIMPISIFR